MPALSEYDLIAAAVAFTLRHAGEVEREVLQSLQTGAQTSDVNALRMLTMQRTILAIGALHAFEGLLQQKKGWPNPFRQLDQMLRAGGHRGLADRFADYRDAINVLKHGDGPSYNKLLERRSLLPFRVKGRGDRFFDEGDVSEGVRLVDATAEFVCQCSAIIEEIIGVLRSLPKKRD